MTDIEKMKVLLTLDGLAVATEAEFEYVRNAVDMSVVYARVETLTDEIREITSTPEKCGNFLAAIVLDMFPEARRSSDIV